MDLLVEGKKVKFTKPVVAQNAEERAQSIFNNIKQPRAGFDYATGQYEPVIQARNLQGKHDSIISQLGKSGSTNISADNIENGEWKTGLLGERINTAATKKEIANRAISHAISSNKNGSSSGVKMRRIKVDREKLNKLKQLMNGKNEDNPGFISRKIAALRNFYKNFLNQANKEKDEGKISWYKNIARVILKYIDKLLAKLDKTETK